MLLGTRRKLIPKELSTPKSILNKFQKYVGPISRNQPIAGSEDEGRGESARPNSFQYCKELSTDERRQSFAGRLREALRREAENSTTTSTTGDWSTDSSSYAVGISISGAEVNDNDIRLVSFRLGAYA